MAKRKIAQWIFVMLFLLSLLQSCASQPAVIENSPTPAPESSAPMHEPAVEPAGGLDGGISGTGHETNCPDGQRQGKCK